MTKNEKINYAELFADSVISLGPFSLKKIGLVSNQTLLKVDTYNLACVPYKISMKGVVLLGSFSRDEMVFFQKFKGALAGLNLVVQHDETPVKVFCRCSLSQMGPMKGRESVGIISVEFKPCPPDMEKAVGDYLLFLDRLHVDFRDLKDKIVPINPESARVLGFNNYATLTSGTSIMKLSLFSLAVNRVEFLASMNSPDLRTNSPVILKLFFQKYQFSVAAKVLDCVRLPTGVQRGTLGVEFSPELVDLLQNYYLQAKLGSKRPAFHA